MKEDTLRQCSQSHSSLLPIRDLRDLGTRFKVHFGSDHVITVLIIRRTRILKFKC